CGARQASCLECLPARVRDRDAADFHHLAAGPDGLPLQRRELYADQAADHVAVEAMGEHNHIFGNALRTAGEHLQGSPLVASELHGFLRLASVSRPICARRHSARARVSFWSCRAIQSLMSTSSGGCRRTVTERPRPVVFGRPRFFGMLLIALRISLA